MKIFFCTLYYLHPLNYAYSLKTLKYPVPILDLHPRSCLLCGPESSLLDIHQDASDAILFFSFLPAVLVSASLCSKQQSYSGNDSFPRSPSKYLPTLWICLFFFKDHRTQNMGYIWQDSGLNSFLAEIMLCPTDLQPEVLFGTLAGRMGQYTAFNIFFVTSLFFKFFVMWQIIVIFWWKKKSHRVELSLTLEEDNQLI